jgi:hypothetical protein
METTPRKTTTMRLLVHHLHPIVNAGNFKSNVEADASNTEDVDVAMEASFSSAGASCTASAFASTMTMTVPVLPVLPSLPSVEEVGYKARGLMEILARAHDHEQEQATNAAHTTDASNSKNGTTSSNHNNEVKDEDGIHVPPGFVLSKSFFEPWTAAIESHALWKRIQCQLLSEIDDCHVDGGGGGGGGDRHGHGHDGAANHGHEQREHEASTLLSSSDACTGAGAGAVAGGEVGALVDTDRTKYRTKQGKLANSNNSMSKMCATGTGNTMERRHSDSAFTAVTADSSTHLTTTSITSTDMEEDDAEEHQHHQERTLTLLDEFVDELYEDMLHSLSLELMEDDQYQALVDALMQGRIVMFQLEEHETQKQLDALHRKQNKESFLGNMVGWASSCGLVAAEEDEEVLATTEDDDIHGTMNCLETSDYFSDYDGYGCGGDDTTSCTLVASSLFTVQTSDARNRNYSDANANVNVVDGSDTHTHAHFNIREDEMPMAILDTYLSGCLNVSTLRESQRQCQQQQELKMKSMQMQDPRLCLIDLPSVAVLVQCQVTPTMTSTTNTNLTSCSGIALSMNPDTNCQDDIVIIANHGEDEGEGGGEVDLKLPDMWVVSNVTRAYSGAAPLYANLKIQDKDRGGADSCGIVVRRLGTSVASSTTKKSKKDQGFVLSNDQVKQVAQLVHKVATLYPGHPSQVHWYLAPGPGAGDVECDTKSKLYVLHREPYEQYVPIPQAMMTAHHYSTATTDTATYNTAASVRPPRPTNKSLFLNASVLLAASASKSRAVASTSSAPKAISVMGQEFLNVWIEQFSLPLLGEEMALSQDLSRRLLFSCEGFTYVNLSTLMALQSSQLLLKGIRYLGNPDAATQLSHVLLEDEDVDQEHHHATGSIVRDNLLDKYCPPCPTESSSSSSSLKYFWTKCLWRNRGTVSHFLEAYYSCDSFLSNHYLPQARQFSKTLDGIAQNQNQLYMTLQELTQALITPCVELIRSYVLPMTAAAEYARRTMRAVFHDCCGGGVGADGGSSGKMNGNAKMILAQKLDQLEQALVNDASFQARIGVFALAQHSEIIGWSKGPVAFKSAFHSRNVFDARFHSMWDQFMIAHGRSNCGVGVGLGQDGGNHNMSHFDAATPRPIEDVELFFLHLKSLEHASDPMDDFLRAKQERVEAFDALHEYAKTNLGIRAAHAFAYNYYVFQKLGGYVCGHGHGDGDSYKRHLLQTVAVFRRRALLFANQQLVVQGPMQDDQALDSPSDIFDLTIQDVDDAMRDGIVEEPEARDHLQELRSRRTQFRHDAEERICHASKHPLLLDSSGEIVLTAEAVMHSHPTGSGAASSSSAGNNATGNGIRCAQECQEESVGVDQEATAAVTGEDVSVSGKNPTQEQEIMPPNAELAPAPTTMTTMKQLLLRNSDTVLLHGQSNGDLVREEQDQRDEGGIGTGKGKSQVERDGNDDGDRASPFWNRYAFPFMSQKNKSVTKLARAFFSFEDYEDADEYEEDAQGTCTRKHGAVMHCLRRSLAASVA